MWGRLRSNLDLGNCRREIVKPLSDLQFSLDLFPDRSAIAVHQSLIQTSKSLTDHPLLKPAEKIRVSLTLLVHMETKRQAMHGR